METGRGGDTSAFGDFNPYTYIRDFPRRHVRRTVTDTIANLWGNFRQELETSICVFIALIAAVSRVSRARSMQEQLSFSERRKGNRKKRRFHGFT